MKQVGHTLVILETGYDYMKVHVFSLVLYNFKFHNKKLQVFRMSQEKRTPGVVFLTDEFYMT